MNKYKCPVCENEITKEEFKKTPGDNNCFECGWTIMKFKKENQNQKPIPFLRLIYAWMYYRCQRLCFSVEIKRRSKSLSEMKTYMKIRNRYKLNAKDTREIINRIRD